jgi:hypothetical protein
MFLHNIFTHSELLQRIYREESTILLGFLVSNLLHFSFVLSISLQFSARGVSVLCTFRHQTKYFRYRKERGTKTNLGGNGVGSVYNRYC